MSNIKGNRMEKGAVSSFISKLSKGLVIPIALLPVAGLFLGIGAGIENIMRDVFDVAETNSWYILPDLIKNIGDVIFANLPLLFAIGIAISFADDSGVAGFTAVVMWLVFNITQSLFIQDIEGGYSIFWYSYVPSSVVTTSSGIQTTQSSVFGGITIGLFAAWVYNKFSTLELPTVIGFFNGTRSVPIIGFMIAPLLGFVFLALWPAFGILLEKFGAALLELPGGIDSFLFGVTERALIPFGLHHAFYTPLWYTSAGGQLVLIDPETGLVEEVLAAGDQRMWFEIQSMGLNYDSLQETYWFSADTFGIPNSDYFIYSTDGKELYLVNNEYAVGITKGANPGQYMQGKYAVMIFGLPAAGAAMVMSAEKKNREVAVSIIAAAAFTSFLTGITEPIEFTFLFLAPLLYVVHCVLAGISFMTADLLNASVGLTFSGGIIDFVIYGMLPAFTGGFNTGWYLLIAIGIVYIPIYYFLFYYWIVGFDVKTPGRDDSSEVKLITKAEYKERKKAKSDQNENKDSNQSSSQEATNNKEPSNERDEIEWLLYNLGGMENLKSIDACITRLRLVLHDTSLLKPDQVFKEMGAAGVMKLGGGATQIIFGARADKFKVRLLKLKKSNNYLSYEQLKEKYEK